MKHLFYSFRYLTAVLMIVVPMLLMNSSCKQDQGEQKALDENVNIEKIPVPDEKEQVQVSFRELTDQELRELADKGISVIHDERTKTCRWSDDPDGTTYGEIECDGNCKVVACNPPSCQDPTICLGCFNPNLTHAGACRPAE